MSKKKVKVDEVKIVKQETIIIDGEAKLKYTLSNGETQVKGL